MPLTRCCVDPTAVVTPAASTPAALLVVSPSAPVSFMLPSATCSSTTRPRHNTANVGGGGTAHLARTVPPPLPPPQQLQRSVLACCRCSLCPLTLSAARMRARSRDKPYVKSSCT